MGQAQRDEGLESSQVLYDEVIGGIESIGRGFNPGIFDASIPTAVRVERAATEALQVEELLKSGKAFSASGQWNLCESRIGNAGVTIMAQKEQLEMNENARLVVANKKGEAHAKALDKAHTALQKYKTDENSLNNKDWGDIVRWVLPEVKVAFLLKDLKRKDTKLATLPREWTTYIPPRVVITPIPITTPVSIIQ